MSDEEFPIFTRQNRVPTTDRQVRNILYGAISTVTGPDASVVHADLARGHQALARRRCRRRFLIGVAIAACTLGCLGALGLCRAAGRP